MALAMHHNRAAVAQGADILGRIETERGCVRLLPTSRPSIVAPWAWAQSSTRARRRAVAIRRISAIRAGVPCRWTTTTAAVRGEIAASVRPDKCRAWRVRHPRTWRSADPVHRDGGPGSGHRGDDHLLSRTDADRLQCEADCVGAGVDANHEPRTQEACKLLLEGFTFGSENKSAAGDHAIDRGIYGVAMPGDPQSRRGLRNDGLVRAELLFRLGSAITRALMSKVTRSAKHL